MGIDPHYQFMGRFITPLLMAGLMLLAATALDWNTELSWYDQHRIEQIGLLGWVALGMLTFWRRDIAASVMCLPRWVGIAFAWAFGLGLVSVITAAYPRFAALEWATFLLLLGLAFLLAKQAGKAGFDVWAIRLIGALAGVIALKIMTAYLAAMLTIGHLDTILLFEGTFSNRRFFGQVASMVIPLLAYPLLRGDLSRGTQAALIMLLAVWWMLVIVSGTRGTWMALAVASVVLGAYAWRTCAGWLRIQMLALGMGVLLFGMLFVWLPSLLGSGALLETRLNSLATLSGREVLWSIAWAQIQAHPWLGIGPMHLASIRNNFGAHPHNAGLQLAAEWGIPAAVAFLLPVVIGLLCLLRRLRQQGFSTNPLLVCLTASLLAATAQSMVDGVIVIPYTQTLLVLVVGWTLGTYYRGGTQLSISKKSHVVEWGAAVISMLALLALLNGDVPEVLNRAEVTQAYVDAGNPLVPPRYWAVGWIP